MRPPLASIALAVLLGVASGTPSAGVSAQQPARARPLPPAERAPTLIVFITIDQFREDYLERWPTQLTGGLGRLLRGGALFTNAFQDHAITETAPGHASTMSGRFPRRTGIVTNRLGVSDPQAPVLGASSDWGASPFRFRGSVLFDWIRGRDERSRALSISMKDRGAILPLGRAHQSVYWYDPSSGRFTTSTYYADSLPTWLDRFNARRLPAQYAGRSWTLLRPASEYREPDSVSGEGGGKDYVFPHVVPADTAAAVRALPGYPFMDEVLLELAATGLRTLDLGRGPQTDLLAISLSTMDVIGHRYGTDSREVHDQVLRLDRALGAFLDSLYAMRDSTRVVVALTADHGVAPAPEIESAREHRPLARVDLTPISREIRAALGARGVPPSAFRFEDGLLLVDRPAFARAGVNADSVEREFAQRVRADPAVLRVDRVTHLAKMDTTTDAIARRWYHMLPPDLPADLVVTLRPHDVWGGGAFGIHGSPHDYDAHVPVLFLGAPFKPGRYAQFARVVDMAPTLAWVAATEPWGELDGHVLWSALR